MGSLDAVLTLLDEPSGTFALWPGSSPVPEMSLLVRFALLEHARRHDEQIRRHGRPELVRPTRHEPRPHAVA